MHPLFDSLLIFLMSSYLLRPKCDCSLRSRRDLSSGMVYCDSCRFNEGLLAGSSGFAAGPAAAAPAAFFFLEEAAADLAFLAGAAAPSESSARRLRETTTEA